MKWLAIFNLSLILIACKGEDLAIKHIPSYVSLEGNVKEIRLSDVQHVLSATHGFTLHKELDFKGLYASSPFHHPRSSAVLALYGGKDFTQQLKEPKLDLKVDDVYVPIHHLKHNLDQFYHQDSNVVELNHETKVSDLDGILENMADDEHSVLRVVSSIYQPKHLNTTEPEMFQLLRQASLILQSIDRVTQNGAGLGDCYSFELYIPNSENDAVNEDINGLVNALIEKVNSMMVELYGDDYVFLVLSLPEAHVVSSRKTRSLLATSDDGGVDAAAINLAQAYSEDYPVMFNIILWLVVVLALLVIFVIHGMMSMDPGGDSIIYRMTTTKLKKEN